MRVTCVTPRAADLVIKTDIMHIVAHEKGKPVVRRGRKTTGPDDMIRTAGLPN